MGLRESISPQRRQLYFRVTAILSAILVLALGFGLAKWGGTKSKEEIANSFQTTSIPRNIVDGAFDPNSLGNKDLPIVTSPPGVKEIPTQTTVLDPPPSNASPEAEFFNKAQMEFRCNQGNSNINKEQFQLAAETGAALIKARTTGENMSVYLDYMSNSPPMVTVQSVTIVHSCARLSRINQKYIELETWWTAVNLHGNGIIDQAVTIAYMDRATMLPVPENDLPPDLRQFATTTYSNNRANR